MQKNEEKYKEYKFVEVAKRLAEVLYLEENREEHLDDLVELVNNNWELYDKREQEMISSALGNLHIDTWHKLKDDTYVEKIYRIHKVANELELFCVFGKIEYFTYKNIIGAACRVEDFELAKEYLEKYKDCLDEEWREDVYNYAKGFIAYFEKDYDNALLLLNTVKLANEYFYFSAKSIQLKIYYETQEYELFLSCAENLRLKIMRQKNIAKERYEMLTNYAKYNRRLGNILVTKGNNKASYYRKLETFREELLTLTEFLHQKDRFLEIIENELSERK